MSGPQHVKLVVRVANSINQKVEGSTGYFPAAICSLVMCSHTISLCLFVIRRGSNRSHFLLQADSHEKHVLVPTAFAGFG